MPLPFDPSTLSRYGGLGLMARSLVEGFLTGVHKSPFKGSSVEFAEHRPYSRGDDIRRIDWRVHGKTDRFYIKEFEEETNLRAYLLLDASGSMGYRGQHQSKFDFARHVAACLAYLMLHQLDAVGLVTLDNKLRRYLPPRASAKHLLRILRVLEETEPGGETALAPLWHELAAHQIRRRGLVVILSDCFDDVHSLMLALKHFRHQKHEVLLFHILAPEEVEFPFRKPTQLQSLESTSDRRLIDPRRLRSAYLERFEAFCRDLRERARGMGVDYQMLRTDEPVDRALGTYLSRRESRGPVPITFLNLAMLAGLAAIALPPIIHLLTRKKFDIAPWAAMQFLDLGKRTRRRMIWDELLLMAVRMGVIAMLVLALAAPMETAGWLARFQSGGEQDIVLILDRSESTGVGMSPDAAKQWAATFIDKLGANDRLAVIQAGAIPKVIAPLDADRDAARSAIHALPSPRGGCDGPAAISLARQILAERHNARQQIVVMTDGQRHGWTDDAAMQRWEAIGSVSPENPPPLSISRFAPERRGDLPRWTLEPLRIGRPIVVVDQPVTIRTELRRLGSGELAIPRVLLEINGQSAEKVDLPAGTGLSASPIEVKRAFPSSGSQLVTVRLVAADQTELDRQNLAIEVAPSLPVLIVDGDERTGPRRHGVEFMREALAPARDPKPSVLLRVIPFGNFSPELLDRDLGGSNMKPSVLILMDVARLSAEQSAAVERFLDSGGGVLVTLGDRADAGYYTRELFRSGRGWLPASVAAQAGVGDPTKAPSPVTANIQHPALELFKRSGPGTLSEARMPRWRTLTPPANNSTATIARLDGEIPWLIEGSRGAGRVIVSAVALDDSNGTNLVELPAFAPLIHELVAYLGAARNVESAVHVGQPFQWQIPKSQPVDGWSVTDPLGAVHPVTATDRQITVRETTEASAYAFKNDKAPTRYFVVRGDPKERDLNPMSDTERERIAALWPGMRWDVEPQQAMTDSAATAAASELGWAAFCGVIGLLCVELWMTRRRALAAA